MAAYLPTMTKHLHVATDNFSFASRYAHRSYASCLIYIFKCHVISDAIAAVRLSSWTPHTILYTSIRTSTRIHPHQNILKMMSIRSVAATSRLNVLRTANVSTLHERYRTSIALGMWSRNVVLATQWRRAFSSALILLQNSMSLRMEWMYADTSA